MKHPASIAEWAVTISMCIGTRFVAQLVINIFHGIADMDATVIDAFECVALAVVFGGEAHDSTLRHSAGVANMFPVAYTTNT